MATCSPSRREYWLRAAQEQVPIASIAFFRFAFGCLMCLGALRFFWYRWIDSLYIKPTYFFTYYGFSWVKPFPAWGMYAVFVLWAISALGIALGAWTQWSIGLFLLTFTYVELLDKTHYLNHYYLVALLAFLMLWMPVGKAFSIDAWRQPTKRRGTTPRWCIWSLRLQLSIVYFFAGVAKLVPHWLIDANPLKVWLAARSDFPLFGWFFVQPWFAHTASIVGALFDLCIAFCLLHGRTRPWAYCAVLAFHIFTGLLFPIGLFPWLMICLTTIFFAPDWPLRWHKVRETSEEPTRHGNAHNVAMSFLAAYFLIQLLLPLRSHLYPGNVHWHEQGYRFSWRVMLIEKNGNIDFLVKDPKSGKRWFLSGHEELTPQQVKMMSTQPDMILTYAHHLARQFRAQGYTKIQVFVRSQVSLHGRPRQPLIDPLIDLAQQPRGWAHKRWITRLIQKHNVPTTNTSYRR